MRKQPSVIKSDRVRMSGRRAIAPGASSPAAPGRPGREAGQATARIVEQGPSTVVIEVTCPCGRTTLLACAYDAASSGGESTEPDTQ